MSIPETITSIIPSTKTNLEKNNYQNINADNDTKKCLFVFSEYGKQQVREELQVFNPVWDAPGWIIDIKYKKEVSEICSRFDLIFTAEYPLPNDLDTLRYNNMMGWFEQNLKDTETDIKALLYNSGIHYTEVNELHDEENHKSIKNLQENRKILNLLSRHRMLENKILCLENKRSVNKASKQNREIGSFHNEYQEEILNYLLKRPLEDLIRDGFSPEMFQPNMFTGLYRTIMEGIVKVWEQDLPVSISQISIVSGNDTLELYDSLYRIERQPLITSSQVTERITNINHHKSQLEFNVILDNTQRDNRPFHEKAAILRKGVDDLQGKYETVLPQSHYLHQIINDLQNPKHKPLATGIMSLDRLIGGGFIKGELGLLSGGAGAGKTAFALQIADSVAEKNSVVIYISVEIGVNKLTQRSLKRLSYQKNVGKAFEDYSLAISKYQTISDNIYLIKGRHGMQVSEIRGIVLSVMRRHREKDILLIIDPFQRLGTGNEKVDSTNETIKVNNLVSQIKEMAEDLNIPILSLSDTVKGHKDNKSGEGSVRGSYMADHTADFVMMLRASRSAFKAVYDIDKKLLEEAKEEDPFIKKVEEELNKSLYKDGLYSLKSDYDKYVSLVTSKVRDSGKFSPLFVYRPQHHLFEDTPLWNNILPKE